MVLNSQWFFYQRSQTFMLMLTTSLSCIVVNREPEKLRIRKRSFRTLLCSDLIPRQRKQKTRRYSYKSPRVLMGRRVTLILFTCFHCLCCPVTTAMLMYTHIHGLRVIIVHDIFSCLKFTQTRVFPNIFRQNKKKFNFKFRKKDN